MRRLPLAAVVVTYRPTPEMIQRILDHAAFLDHIVVVDNTEGVRIGGLDASPNITYLPMGTNQGLGEALNAGVEGAARLGYAWVLLLDQDSTLSRLAAESAFSAIADDIGIVALRQTLRGKDSMNVTAPATSAFACRNVTVTMTSGSILNAQAYRTCGPFEAKLFIDYVDHDYCLRLRRAGYKVVQCDSAVLDHQLGDPKTVNCLGLSTSFITHQPFRSYYITRNGLYVLFRYFADDPRIALGVAKVLGKELVKAVVLENDKPRRLGFMALGLWHWLVNHYGKVAQP